MMFKRVGFVEVEGVVRMTFHAISPPALNVWLGRSGVERHSFSLQGFSGQSDAVTRERSRNRLVFGSEKESYEPGADILSDLHRLVTQEEGGDPELEFLQVSAGGVLHCCSLAYQFERPGQSRRQQPEPKKS